MGTIAVFLFLLMAAACTNDGTGSDTATTDDSTVSDSTESDSTVSDSTVSDSTVSDSTETDDSTSVDDGDSTTQTLDDAAPAEAPSSGNDGPAALAPGLSLDADGLTILDPDAGETVLLSFGEQQGPVIAGLEAVLGPADETNDGNQECGNGQAAVASWDDRLFVDFDSDGAFLSWVTRPGSDLTTSDDVGLGSMVSELGDATFVESTLGNEFEAGDLGGLASEATPSGIIEQLWAGSICAFR